jgi:hypothetical protein
MSCRSELARRERFGPHQRWGRPAFLSRNIPRGARVPDAINAGNVPRACRSSGLAYDAYRVDTASTGTQGLAVARDVEVVVVRIRLLQREQHEWLHVAGRHGAAIVVRGYDEALAGGAPGDRACRDTAGRRESRGERSRPCRARPAETGQTGKLSEPRLAPRCASGDAYGRTLRAATWPPARSTSAERRRARRGNSRASGAEGAGRMTSRTPSRSAA